jgi:hypothetical protein
LSSILLENRLHLLELPSSLIMHSYYSNLTSAFRNFVPLNVP